MAKVTASNSGIVGKENATIIVRPIGQIQQNMVKKEQKIDYDEAMVGIFCCCCIPIQTGVGIISAIPIVSSIVCLLTWILNSWSTFGIEVSSNSSHDIGFIGIVLLIIIISFAAGVIGIYGAMKYDTCCCRVLQIFCMIEIIGSLVIIVEYGIVYDIAPVIAGIVWLVMWIHFNCVIQIFCSAVCHKSILFVMKYDDSIFIFVHYR